MLYTTILNDYNSARKLTGMTANACKEILGCVVGDAQTRAKRDQVEMLDDAAMIAMCKSFIDNLELSIKALAQEKDVGKAIMLDAHFKTQISMLKQYIPQQMTEEQIRQAISIEFNDQPVKMGIAMRFLKTKFAGLYDGNLASAVAKAYESK